MRRAFHAVPDYIRVLVATAIGAILAMIALMMAVGFVRVQGHEYRTGGIPRQFYQQLEARDLLDDYRGVFAVAHNSGGTLDTTIEALAHGAEVIEIDVVSIGGQLYSSHRRPLPIVSRYIFRGPSLEAVWEEAADAEVIKLDLKGASPRFVRQVVQFLRSHEPRQTMVVSASVEVLGELAEGAPDAIRMLTVGDRQTLEAILEDPDFFAVIDGVSVFHSVVTEERVLALHDLGIFTLAYTVNDLPRLNELVASGVDAITTDNLAIMELLGGPQVEETPLRGRVATP